MPIADQLLLLIIAFVLWFVEMRYTIPCNARLHVERKLFRTHTRV